MEKIIERCQECGNYTEGVPAYSTERKKGEKDLYSLLLLLLMISLLPQTHGTNKTGLDYLPHVPLCSHLGLGLLH